MYTTYLCVDSHITSLSPSLYIICTMEHNFLWPCPHSQLRLVPFFPLCPDAPGFPGMPFQLLLCCPLLESQIGLVLASALYHIFHDVKSVALIHTNTVLKNIFTNRVTWCFNFKGQTTSETLCILGRPPLEFGVKTSMARGLHAKTMKWTS